MRLIIFLCTVSLFACKSPSGDVRIKELRDHLAYIGSEDWQKQQKEYGKPDSPCLLFHEWRAYNFLRIDVFEKRQSEGLPYDRVFDNAMESKSEAVRSKTGEKAFLSLQKGKSLGCTDDHMTSKEIDEQIIQFIEKDTQYNRKTLEIPEPK